MFFAFSIVDSLLLMTYYHYINVNEGKKNRPVIFFGYIGWNNKISVIT